MHDIVTFLRGFPPFDEADEQDLDDLAGAVDIEYFARGSLLLDAALDTPADVAYVVRTGHVEMLDQAGTVLDVLGPGDLVGLPSLLTDMPPGLSTRAAEDTLTYRLPIEPLVRLLSDRSGMRFLARLVKQRTADASVAPDPDVAAASVAPFARPVVTVDHQRPLREVLALIQASGGSSALVARGEEWGIITDRDLRDRVLATGIGLEIPVGAVTTFPARTVDPMLPVGQAVLEMLSRGIHHLPVLTPDGEPVGMLEDLDLLNAQSHTPLQLRRAIGRADSPEELAALSEQVRTAALDAQRSGRAAPEVTALISLLADAITERALHLHLVRRGPAPARFAWVVTGSVARGEAVLSSDLDNLLVWDGDDDDPRIKAWLRELAADVIATLEACGLSHDTHGVRADDARFSRSAATWVQAIGQWTADPTQAQADVYLATLADARVVHGEEVWRPVRAELLQRLTTPLVRRTLQRVAVAHRPPTGFVRDFVIESSGEHKGALDLKRGGTEIITKIARFSAATSRSHALGTRERLRFATAVGVLAEADTADLIDAFEFLQSLRLEHQLVQTEQGLAPDDFVAPAALSGLNRRHLRDAFRAVARVQQHLPGLTRLLPP